MFRAGWHTIPICVFVLLAGCKPKARSTSDAGATSAPEPVRVTSLVTSSATSKASAAASTAASPQGHDCIGVDAGNLSGDHIEVDGVVERGRHGHPNGSTFTFYFLRLATPRCVTGDPETPKTDEIQLAPMNDDIKLETLLGKKVHISGDAFPWHTAWHVRPVLMSFDKMPSPSK